MASLCAESIRVMRPLFQAEEGGSIPTSALSVKELMVEGIAFEHAQKLNEIWHSKLPRIGTGCVAKMNGYLCFAATHKGIAYAVAIWSNPVARNLPQQSWLELRRLACSPEMPRNGCSWMLGVMARLIRRMRPEVDTLVSYSLIGQHSGTIYSAAGWNPTAINAQGGWNRKARSRPEAQQPGSKQRWEKTIAK